MKRGETGKLKYDFDTASNLEVCIKEVWYRVTARDFRSFDGKRKINGEEYIGPVYLYKTNEKVMSLYFKEKIVYSNSVDYIKAVKRIGENFEI